MNLAYDTFVSLSGRELSNVCERALSAGYLHIDETTIKRFSSEIHTYDEYHCVYAMLLGMKHSPERFAPLLPSLLQSESLAVFCAAYNVMRDLPISLRTPELLSGVHAAHLRFPDREIDQLL